VGQKLSEQDYSSVNKWVRRNHDVFTAMLMAPVPTIAAITGHAFGNGAILAAACDFRFMRSDRGFFCLPEIDLGIQFLPSQIEWLKRAIPYHFLIRLQLTGDRVTAPELERHNVIIKACSSREETIAEAVAYAKTFNKSRENMAEMKRRTYKHILDVMANVDPPYMTAGPQG